MVFDKESYEDSGNTVSYTCGGQCAHLGGCSYSCGSQSPCSATCQNGCIGSCYTSCGQQMSYYDGCGVNVCESGCKVSFSIYGCSSDCTGGCSSAAKTKKNDEGSKALVLIICKQRTDQRDLNTD